MKTVKVLSTVVIALVLVSALLAGCGFFALSINDVRFQNSSEADIEYGIRLGDAIHDEPLPIGEISPYYGTETGYCRPQYKNASGIGCTTRT